MSNLSSDRGMYMALGAVGVVTLLTAFFCTIVSMGMRIGWALAVTVPALPIAWSYSRTWLRSLSWRGRYRNLPRLDADDTVVTTVTTLVAVPVLLSSPARADTMINRLSQLAAAHPQPQFRFALLSDFVDADAERIASDDEILQTMERRIAALNATTRDAIGDRFFVLHRRRCWSETQQCWIGWERKRGKLLELFRLLSGREGTTFEWQFGDMRGLLQRTTVPFVIAIDESTWLPSGHALELVRTAAHPLNRPSIDQGVGRVVSGYGIVQPRVDFVPAGHEPVARAAKGDEGTRFHGNAPGSFQFRVLDAASHMGAGGLYHVEPCLRALDGTFPVEQVLQHDLLDGFVAHTGEVTDVNVIQQWPDSFLKQSRRGHRWLRGVFQAVPWLFPTTRNTTGRGRNPLTGLQRYLLAELVVAELAKPASAFLMIAAWTVLPGPTMLWTVIAYPPLTLNLLRVAGLAGRGAWRHLRRKAIPIGGVVGPMAFSTALFLVVLAYECIVVTDAAGRVVWRMTVSRRQLLEWTPRESYNAARASGPLPYWRIMWGSPAVAVVTLLAVAFLHAERLLIAAPFLLAWLAAPALVQAADRLVFRPATTT